jgi:hypothetical protein
VNGYDFGQDGQNHDTIGAKKIWQTPEELAKLYH